MADTPESWGWPVMRWGCSYCPGVPEDRDRSYEVLAALVASLRAGLAQAQAHNAELVARVAELEAQVNRTSKNSSQPPSADGLAKGEPKPRSLRKKTGRKPGGQDGHDGN